jgi:Zn-dependent peptidase ImmA (M78 family)
MLDMMVAERLPAVLDEVAAGVLENAKWTGPAVDAVAVARRLGIAVARDRKLNGRARYVRLSAVRGRSRGAIFVGEALRPERLQWAVAHELGEIAAHRVFASLEVRPDHMEPCFREQVANELARRILLPKRSFPAAGQACRWDLIELKSAFPSASHELIARRMLDFPLPVVMTVFDHGKIHWRRGNQVAIPPALSREERSLMRAAHQSQTYQESRGEAVFVRAWPVHEPGWKREILRTEPV